MDEGVIGIDLGTTNSVVAAVVGKKVEVIPDEFGNRLHPSVVAFMPNGEVLVGHAAKARRHIDPKHTIYSSKRLIGQNVNNEVVRLTMAVLLYQTEEGPNSQPQVVVRGKRYSIPDISGFILRHLKQCAERHLGKSVTRAVITVPANFTDAQRQATKYAGELAGLRVLRVLNEPTAAALAYGFGRSMDEKIAIYDLGGGTFDVTVLQIRDKIFEVLATGGDSFLGGDDFDRQIQDAMARRFLEAHRVDLRQDPAAWSKLTAACEQIKCRLSDELDCAGKIHDIAQTGGGKQLDLDFSMNRSTYEKLIDPYIERSIMTCREVLAAANMTGRDLDELILVGGSTRTPLVRKMVQQYFGREPQMRINPDETVAYGAALQASALSVGGMDPGKFYSLLLDVCPRGLGIAVAGGYNETIVEKNTTVPVERTRVFTTSKDFQTEVVIHVSQGEQRVFEDNDKLGLLALDGLEPRRRGETSIEVTFTIDSDGILNVRALDQKTRKETRAKMQVQGAPTDEQRGQPHDNLPGVS